MIGFLRRGFGIKKQDIEDLKRVIPSNDTIASQQKMRVHHGSIEEAENQIPWLRARRRRRPL